LQNAELQVPFLDRPRGTDHLNVVSLKQRLGIARSVGLEQLDLLKNLELFEEPEQPDGGQQRQQ